MAESVTDFPIEIRAEGLSQSIRVSRSAQPEIQAGLQSGDPMHEQHQMQPRRKRPGIERRRGSARQRGIQNGQKRFPRDAGDAVEVHRTAALADQLTGGMAAGGRRGRRPRNQITGFGLFRTRGLSFRGRNGFINHRPLDVGIGSTGWRVRTIRLAVSAAW